YVVAFLLRILIIYLMGIFCFTKCSNYVGTPIAIGVCRLSFENPVSNQTEFFVLIGLRFYLYLTARHTKEFELFVNVKFAKTSSHNTLEF
ncbi:hypothetical protein, partial [Flavobacterium aquidurense]|uniref:hypothetical protein n=1 Tax=Flavobacterium aquidurense TaxID=362413 RepID=UPI001A97A0C5